MLQHHGYKIIAAFGGYHHKQSIIAKLEGDPDYYPKSLRDDMKLQFLDKTKERDGHGIDQLQQAADAISKTYKDAMKLQIIASLKLDQETLKQSLLDAVCLAGYDLAKVHLTTHGLDKESLNAYH